MVVCPGSAGAEDTYGDHESRWNKAPAASPDPDASDFPVLRQWELPVWSQSELMHSGASQGTHQIVVVNMR